MSEVEFHSDYGYGPRHAAVNVKVYSSYPKSSKMQDYFERLGWSEDEFEKEAESILEGMQHFFWNEDVQEIAKEHGFEKVHSEGRSGGWAVPYPTMGEEDFEDDPELVKRFLAFQTAVKAEVNGVDDAIFEELKYLWSEAELEFLKERSVTLRSILAWKEK